MHKRSAFSLFSIILSLSVLVAPVSAETYAVHTSWGSLGTNDGQFKNPYGIAVNDSGYVYVADTYNHRIEVFSADGAFVTAWGSFGVGDEQFMYPYAVAVNESGAVHVADNFISALKLFTPSGTHLGTHPFPGNVKGIAVDDASWTFCTDLATDSVSTYNDTHLLERTWGSNGNGDGEFFNPTGIEVTATEVFVVDTDHHRIQVFSKDGSFLRKWPSDSIAGSAEGDFNSPYDVAINSSGFLFVTDTGNNRVELFTQAGNFADTFSCDGPNGIAIGPDDRVYVTSAGGDCVYVYRIPPAPTVAGITPSSATGGSSCVAATVSGSDFQTSPEVRLRKGASTIIADNVTRLSADAITCTLNLSSAAAGSWDVLVINDDGKEGTLAGGFTVTNVPPHITAIAPDEGISGDQLDGVLIKGSGFLTAPLVRLYQSGQPYIVAGNVSCINGTRISCSLDLEGAAPGAWDVIVRNTDGQEDILSAGFTINETVMPIPDPTPDPTPSPTATPASRPDSSGNGGPSSTSAAYASDLLPGENRTLMLTSGALQAVTIRVNSAADSVLVTARKCGIPAGTGHPNGTLYQCTEVMLYRISDGDVEAVWFTFSIPASWLAEQGFSPAGVVMLRFHDGTWQELSTECTGETNGQVWFQAESRGCSIFAITCKPYPESDREAIDAGQDAPQIPTATRASPVQPHPAETTQTTDAPKSPLAAAPLISLPFALMLRRRS